MSKGMLWCEVHETDCGYMHYGTCAASRCNVTDPEYIARQQAIEQRRDELYNKALENKKEEKEAAKNIRTQRVTRQEQLKAEIEKTTKMMNRYYTKGWRRSAEQMSRKLKDLQDKLEAMS